MRNDFIDQVYSKSCQKMDELPNESIDCILTSPPYWGLRNYGEDVAEVWGGDSNCEHKWDFEQVRHDNLRFRGKNSDVRNEQKVAIHSDSTAKSGFCVKCGAWHGQLGLEPTFQLYLDHMMIVCAEVKRVLKKTGSFWLNMGDTYGGSWQNFGSREGGQRTKSTQSFERRDNPQFYPPTARVMQKCLIGIPSRLRNRLVDEQGWTCRNAIIWHKPNAMPSSVKDRCSNSYEFLFHLVKAKKYYYDLDTIREPHKESFLKDKRIQRIRQGEELTHKRWKNYQGTKAQDPCNARDSIMRTFNLAGRNPGDVWTITTQPRPEAHFATFPDKLCIKPILATCPAEICRKCGKARVRILKVNRPSNYDPSIVDERYQEHCRKSGGSKGTNRPLSKIFKDSLDTTRQTIGWTDCGCNAGFDSGVLLDPFAGRGTALIMTKKLGRHYVGYELKKEYCEKLIEPTLAEIDPLFQKIAKENNLA